MKINAFDYAEQITKALPNGILLNANGDKFNSMVIGWGHLGVIWGLPAFTVYVRQSRYTKPQLDQTQAFSISVPAAGERLSREVFKAFGTQSGRDINKADFVTLMDGQAINVPAIKEYPLTLECKVLYQQDQVLADIPQEVKDRYYSHGTDVGDFHTAYIGQIVDAYIIR